MLPSPPFTRTWKICWRCDHLPETEGEKMGWWSCYLEDHPSGCKWLISMVIVNPQNLGLWDPFQTAMKMADKWRVTVPHLHVEHWVSAPGDRLAPLVSLDLLLQALVQAPHQVGRHLAVRFVQGRKLRSMVIGSVGYFTPIYSIFRWNNQFCCNNWS